MEQVLTLQDVADIFKVDAKQVYELTRNRYMARHGFALKSFKIGKELRFLRSDLDEFIEVCKKGRG